MKDRPPSSVYVPPHQRMKSVIAPSPPPANGSSISAWENQGSFLASNPSFLASVSSPSPKRQHSPIRLRFGQESKQLYNQQNSWHYNQMKIQLQCNQKQDNAQCKNTKNEPSIFPATVMSCKFADDNLDHWKRKFTVFLREKDLQEFDIKGEEGPPRL